MGFVSGRLCHSAGHGWEIQVKYQLSFQVKCSSQPGPYLGSLVGLVSGPSLSRMMKDCTVNSLNEGLRCQNIQNALSGVQINRTGSYSES